ncbi:MAG: hypothetical protein JWM98_2149 [Thermoleophilia bacterium]|nr:hypothetical protein [Thermoleophilia bacterium]
MPADAQPFQYAMLRLVPRVERGEGFNVGVVLFCRPLEFLGARTHLDTELLARFAPQCDAAAVAERLAAIERVAAGDPDAGAIAQLTISERFHFLVAPASTMVQASPAHTGMTGDPAGQLDRLFDQLVVR